MRESLWPSGSGGGVTGCQIVGGHCGCRVVVGGGHCGFGCWLVEGRSLAVGSGGGH